MKINLYLSNINLREHLPWVFEFPILVYFALHFFPPGPAALANVSLALAVIWAIWQRVNIQTLKLGNDTGAVLFFWLLLAGALGASIVVAQPELQMAAYGRYWTWIGKGTLFGLVMLVYVDSDERACRLFYAALFALALMFAYCFFDTALRISESGKFPLQRDYVYWMLPFFPFAVGLFGLSNRWRFPAGVAAVAVITMAVSMGFRGAMLAVACTILVFSFFGNFKRIIFFGAIAAVLVTATLVLLAPEHGQYVLVKLHQTNTSSRALGLWLPVLDMALSGPLFGYGYGDNIFAYHYVQELPSHPGWVALPPLLVNGMAYMSPHGIPFEVLFALGFPGVALLVGLFLMLLRLLFCYWRRRADMKNSPLLVVGVSALVAIIANHGVLGITDAPSWRTLPIFLAISVAAFARYRTVQSEPGQHK